MPNTRSDQHGQPVPGVHIPGAVAVVPGERARGWPYSSAPIRLSHIHYPSPPLFTMRRYVSSPKSHYPHCQIRTQSPQGSMGRKSRTTCNLTLTSRQVSFSSPTGGQVQQPAIIPTVDGAKGSSSILTMLILLHF